MQQSEAFCNYFLVYILMKYGANDKLELLSSRVLSLYTPYITAMPHKYNGIWNHWQCICFINKLFRLTTKKYQSATLVVLCEGKSLVTSSTDNNARRFHYSDVIMGAIANHQPHNCLLKHLFRSRSKKTPKLHVTGPCTNGQLRRKRFPLMTSSSYICIIMLYVITLSWLAREGKIWVNGMSLSYLSPLSLPCCMQYLCCMICQDRTSEKYSIHIWYYFVCCQGLLKVCRITSLKARFMGPTWGPSGADRTQVGPMLVP